MGATKKMIDRDFESQMEYLEDRLQFELIQEDLLNQTQLHINDILDEAGRWGMREEVYQSAQQNLQHDSSLDVITAYNHAFGEWIR